VDELTFTSRGSRCAAWHLHGVGDGFAGPHGRPCVVMAHGFGGTRDSGLLGYARGLAAAGLDVLLFDYRGFGGSEGSPRQLVSFRRQRADYREAVAAARTLPDVDPERIVLWGTSYSGGHVVAVAAGDRRIAAAISLTPAMDGAAALVALARHAGPWRIARLVGHGLRDLGRAMTGRRPHHLPLAGEPGSMSFINAPGALAGYRAVAGPTWRNEACARAVLEVALNRPVRFARRLRSPLLVQIGENDAVAPPGAAHRAAALTGPGAETKTYPVDHFDVYDGVWQRHALADQIAFLSSRLSGWLPSENQRETPQ
jgi:uncharacterized protein